MRNASLKTPEVYEEAGCATAYALIGEQMGLEAYHPFDIVARRFENDEPGLTGQLIPVRYRYDWTVDVRIRLREPGEPSDFLGDNAVGLPNEGEFIALRVGAA